ncbi:MAG: hypothetical protein PHE15_07070, partial [Dehalococcoidales bacterium]|nr:hypothetical protein [Dehalococcoidales bacterium]
TVIRESKPIALRKFFSLQTSAIYGYIKCSIKNLAIPDSPAVSQVIKFIKRIIKGRNDIVNHKREEPLKVRMIVVS